MWTDEEVKMLRRCLDSGLSYSQIAAILGRTRSEVAGKVHREQQCSKSDNGCSKRGDPWTKKRVGYIRCLSEMGCTLQEAAAALGVKKGLVSYYASVNQISFPRQTAA